MKTRFLRFASFLLVLCLVFSNHASAAAALLNDDVDAEAAAIYAATEKTMADEKTINEALFDMGFTAEALRKMKYAQKERIYRSMLAVNGFDDYTFGGFVEETVITQNLVPSNARSGGTFTDIELTFSAPYIYRTNNINRAILYPTFEFHIGTYINWDTFSFAVNETYWQVVGDPSLDVTVYGALDYEIDSFSMSPTMQDHAGASFKLTYLKGDSLTRFLYTGVGCMVLTPKVVPEYDTMKVIVNYARSVNDNSYITISPFGEIAAYLFDRSVGRELSWGD